MKGTAQSGHTGEARTLDGAQHSNEKNIHNERYVSDLMERWRKYVDVLPEYEEDPNDYRKKTTAMVLESTYQSLPTMVQQSPLPELVEAESTQTNAIDAYAQTIFPILMKVFPNLIAHELVSVQPMSGPIGAVFHFDYKHGTSKGSTDQGENLVESFNEHYSSEFVDGEYLATGDGTNFGGGGSELTASLSFNPVYPNDDSVADPDMKVRIVEEDSNGNVQQEAIDDGSGNFTFDPSGGNTSGSIDYATGSISNFSFENTPANGNVIKAYYFYDMEGNQQVPQITLDIAMEEIRAKSRKLNVTWSAESADDLRHLHGVEGESQLLGGVSNEIGLEIDREILSDLQDASQTSDTWNRTGKDPGLAEMDYLKTLLTTLSGVSSSIHEKTKRAPANWIVTSPQIASIFAQFQSHGDFIPSAPTVERPSSYGNVTSDFGIFEYGTLMNRWQVYQDPYMDSNKILMGLKGRSYLDAGYVYAPYVPLQFTPTFLDPSDHNFKKGLRTRYAKRKLRGEFFGDVTVNNLTVP